jgi:hypothetical protein
MKPVLTIPIDIAEQLPKAGRAPVIVFTRSVADAEWQAAAYEQFMRDDTPEDAVNYFEGEGGPNNVCKRRDP